MGLTKSAKLVIGTATEKNKSTKKYRRDNQTKVAPKSETSKTRERAVNSGVRPNIRFVNGTLVILLGLITIIHIFVIYSQVVR